LDGSPNAGIKSGAGCVGYGFCHFYILHNLLPLVGCVVGVVPQTTKPY
jgi:hypothetical protein